MSSSLIFDGDVQVYLYGQNALIPTSLTDQALAMVIGIETSDLIVNEHRYKIIQLIKNTSPDSYPDGFLQSFNRPARVEIQYEPNQKGLKIDLYDIETVTEDNIPILWMGVLENNRMPNYEVEWEVLKSIDGNNAAFCALVKTLPVLSSNQFSLVSTSDDGVLFSN
jgi:hypothetical protein